MDTAPQFAETLVRYRGKRVLVTGGGGYIGSQLIAELLSLGSRVTATSRDVAVRPKTGGVRWIQSDFESDAAWLRLVADQDLVFHLAAQTSYAKANAAPIEDWLSNVAPLVRLLQACLKSPGRPRVVFASTATVSGCVERMPVPETVVPRPFTVYDVHKLAAETYLEFFHRQEGISTVSLRLANVYGPSPAQSGPDRGVLNKMAGLALQGKDLTVFGSGRWVRDYVHLSDVVRAFLSVGVADDARVGGRVFNLCTGVGTSLVDVVSWVAEAAFQSHGKRVAIRHIEPEKRSAIDEREYVGDRGALTAATGWVPRVSVREGVRDLVQTLAKAAP